MWSNAAKAILGLFVKQLDFALRGATICLAVAIPSAFGQDLPPSLVCGSLENAYGPYDYANPMQRREYLPIVEGAHLTTDVVMLRRGATAVSPLPDLDYTLRASPNHHIALDAMARLHRREGAERLPGSHYSLSCWFERAQRFNPTDGMVPMIYGIHMFRRGQYDESEQQLSKAVELMPQSAEAHYNLGLLYVKLERYEDALNQAKTAYEMGYPLPGLKNQLARAGHWPTEP